MPGDTWEKHTNLSQESRDASTLMANLYRQIMTMQTRFKSDEIVRMNQNAQKMFESMTIDNTDSEKLLPELITLLEVSRQLLKLHFKSTGTRIVQIKQEAIKQQEQLTKSQRKAKTAKRAAKDWNGYLKQKKKDDSSWATMLGQIQEYYEENDKKFDELYWMKANKDLCTRKIADIFG